LTTVYRLWVAVKNYFFFNNSSKWIKYQSTTSVIGNPLAAV
jgi:hypothetical protein